MIRRTEKRRALCLALLIANLAFIWGNSLLPGHISEALSQWVKGLVSFLLGSAPDDGGGHGLLRKLAHFTEFAGLGLWLSWLTGMYQKNLWRSVMLSIACGFAVACVDEAIQLLTPDRGPRFTDVLIDTAGVAVGIGLLWLCVRSYQRKKQKIFGGKEQ